MINKVTLQNIVDRYYLGLNESVKWIIKDNNLSIDFMTPTKDVIGNITCTDFQLESSELAIFDTKKFLNLINICNGDLLLELEKTNKIPTKLHISDQSFNLVYALADSLLINKVGTVNVPEWVVDIDLESENVANLIKAKNALTGIDNMLVSTSVDINGSNVCSFIFGDESGHNNKITYQIQGDIKELDLSLPFNSDMFRTILQANKDMDTGKLYVSSMGLMGLEFVKDTISSKYFMVRKTETNF